MSTKHSDDIKKKSSQCGRLLATCSGLARSDIYTRLSQTRVVRKQQDVTRIFNNEGQFSWNEVFYILLMKILGDELNRDVFMEVARRVPMYILLREQHSPINIEALLIATAGFIDNYNNDEYISELKRHSDYLLHKHQITPVSIKHWNFQRVRPYNHPVIRLSQVAKIISMRNYLFDGVIMCRDMDDIDSIFTITATDHLLNTHSHLTGNNQHSISIGRAKRELIGINLVIPLQFAYGCYLDDDEINFRAHNLQENIPPESNRYIRAWQECGVAPCSALETQALIQLSTCFCRQSLCEECPLARRLSLNG